MDSRLLNVFHDDPFDGNYCKYDADTEADFWSNSNEPLGLQLTETLHGILPMAPIDESVDLYGNSLLKDDYSLECKEEQNLFQNKNGLIFDDYGSPIEHHNHNMKRGGGGGGGGTTRGHADAPIEIVTVDPNDNFEFDSDLSDNSSELSSDNNDEDDLADSGNRSYSRSTFRSRTDSSSIGDYESHSSDYDDDDNDINGDDVLTNKTEFNENRTLPDNCLIIRAEDYGSITGDSNSLPRKGIAPVTQATSVTSVPEADVDALGLQIDASTFDLAEFITQDDHHAFHSAMPMPVPDPVAKSFVNSTVQVISSKSSEYDSDSDVIVDVETVENDIDTDVKLLWHTTDINIIPEENDEDDDDDDEEQEVKEEEEEDTAIPFLDNVKKDPSWTPAAAVVSTVLATQRTVKAEQSVVVPQHPAKIDEDIKPDVSIEQEAAKQHPTAQQVKQKSSRNFSVVPSKRQCDFLKGKFGLGRGKNLSMQRNSKSSKTAEATKSKQLEDHPPKSTVHALSVPEQKIPHLNLVDTSQHDRNKKKSVDVEQKLEKISSCVVSGRGGKNLALIKHDRLSIEDESSIEKPAVKIKQEVVTPQKPVSNPLPESLLPPVPVVKRKLNLEEYKRRRENPSVVEIKPEKTELSDKGTICEQSQQPSTASLVAASMQTIDCAIAVPNVKLKDDVTFIVKNLKDNTIQKPFVDPITEAKNKVLRLQLLKKAQQIRIIDSTVSAKVGRVTKLLPLKDIVKNSQKTAKNETRSSCKAFSDYEEIVIVSASCNTDISIPPDYQPNSRSLLKSSALLYNISNTFQKVQLDETVKISSNSLIASIQDVVVKQNAPLFEPSPTAKSAAQTNLKTKKATNYHGEDKVIMHLPKNRIRQPQFSVSIQTDLLPEFPPLPLPVRTRHNRQSRKSMRRNYRKRKVSSSVSGGSDSENDEDNHSYRSRSRSMSYSPTRHRRRRYSRTSPNSRRHHRSSISSSYSESDRKLRHNGRQKRSRKYSTSSDRSVRSRSPRSRSRSSAYRNSRSRSRSMSSSRSRSRRPDTRTNFDRNVLAPAVEERRIVYVGRIEQETNKEILRRKFISYGPIKQITIHYKDTGMKYGFVTFERAEDAFTVIDSSSRDSEINMYDISFGGRRAFCRSSYADLDNAGINTYQSYVFPKAPEPVKEEDSFEALLLKVKAKINATKSSTSLSKM